MDFPENEQPQAPIQIDPSKLSEDALTGIIENFIMRSGTDYGPVEASHETKINQIKKQLKNDGVKVVYDPNTESVTLMTTQDFKKTTAELSIN